MLDLADGSSVSRSHLEKREYHHLFPDALLRNDGKLESAQINVALNCALITWQTNRSISAKDPVRYLEERTEHAIHGQPEIQKRLATHAIPFEALNVGDYASIEDAEDRMKRVRSDYDAFLDARAELILQGAQELCAGRNWP